MECGETGREIGRGRGRETICARRKEFLMTGAQDVDEGGQGEAKGAVVKNSGRFELEPPSGASRPNMPRSRLDCFEAAPWQERKPRPVRPSWAELRNAGSSCPRSRLPASLFPRGGWIMKITA